MASAQLGAVLRHIRNLAATQQSSEQSDGALLRVFLNGNDPGAFEVLVRRHGPMVLRVCLRTLGNAHDAEDALQATFLVLAQKAKSIRKRESLASWLHGVAYRMASHAKRAAARRQRHESQASPAHTPDPAMRAAWQEIQALLDKDIDRLPETLRTPFVYCCLENKSAAETARQLDLQESTISMRLSRARKLLQERLSWRGVSLTAVLASAAIGGTSASAAGLPNLVVSMARAATQVAAGQTAAPGLVSTKVTVLTKGALKAMFLSKLKTATVVLLAVGVAGTGSGALTYRTLTAFSAGKETGRQEDRERTDSSSPTSSPSLLVSQSSQPPAPLAGLVNPQAAPPSLDGRLRVNELKNKEAWSRKLAELAEADRRELRVDAWAIGAQLAQLPPDDGFALLKENWKKMARVETRQQLLSAWYRTEPYPLHPRNHPRLLDVLDLGMRDPSPEVQSWALTMLCGVAFQDFAEDFQAYEAWYQANRRKPLAKVIADSLQGFVAEAADLEAKDALKRAKLLADNRPTFRDDRPTRQAAVDAGLLRILERWTATGVGAEAREVDRERAEQALGVILFLKPGETYLRRVVVPLLAKDKPTNLRTAAIRTLGDKENAWAVDLLLKVLKGSLEEKDKQSFSTVVWAAGGALGDIKDPRAIPTMIAVIDADNTSDTVYGVGHFGLTPLTGVRHDDAHTGAWWRQWWDKNKAKYPESVGNLAIPRLPSPLRGKGADAEGAKTSETLSLSSQPSAPKEEEDPDPLADVADVPSQDLNAGGDAKKRYFLIGARQGAKPPDGGYGLLFVLPGGDGSADFNPFVRRIYKNALPKGWLIAQPVAPMWDKNQFNKVVWPTAGLRYPAAKFTTEEFIEAVLTDVKAKATIDPKRVMLLGWSSGGPPCYSLALRKDSPVTGIFIAMSVFKPDQMPALENAKRKNFYLLQSPDDRVTPIRFAESAEKALRAAGANVKLQRYEGGHGWRGDVWDMIGAGITWLEQQAKAKP